MTLPRTKLIAQVLPSGMTNQKYSVLVRSYLYGQFRIQLTDTTVPDLAAPEGHGSIVRECCTYKPTTMLSVLAELAEAAEPEEYLTHFETPKTCEVFGYGRIRLDQLRLDDLNG